MKSYSWIAFCLTLLTACTLLPSGTPSPANKAPVEDKGQTLQLDTARTGSVTTLLKYAQTFVALPADAQRREFSRLNTRHKTEYMRMQLATVSIMPGSRYRDFTRASALLDEQLKAADSHDEGLRSLAWAIKSMLGEQQKQDETIQQLMLKLKDEQKLSESLQHKLDELLAVEKTMNERREARQK